MRNKGLPPNPVPNPQADTLVWLKEGKLCKASLEGKGKILTGKRCFNILHTESSLIKKAIETIERWLDEKNQRPHAISQSQEAA